MLDGQMQNVAFHPVFFKSIGSFILRKPATSWLTIKGSEL